MTEYIEGWTTAKPTAWGLSADREPGKEQFAIAFEILDGDDAGKTITWFGGFGSDAAFEYSVKQIKKCGWTGSDLANVELSEAPVSIFIEYETYEGKSRAKVKAVGNGGGAGVKTMEPAQAKSFAAKMANRIKAFDAKNGTGAKPATRSQSGGGGSSNGRRPPPPSQYGSDDDSDIPFVSQTDTTRRWLR